MDNPFRRGKPAQHHRPLVASAARVKIGDRHEAERLKRYRQGWQHEALAYADAIGEIRYPLHFMAAQTTRIRVYPAILVDPDQPPLPLHEAADLPDLNIPDDLIAAAQLDLDTLGMGQIGLRPILSGTYLNSKTTGEMWLTGWTDPDGEEHWEIRSIDEVHIDDQARVWLRDEPGTGGPSSDALRPFPDDGYITRIWRPHYRYRALADSPMKSILDSSEELLLASRVVRSLLRNRIAGNGLAVLAQELSLPGVNPGDEDPEGDPLFEALTTAMMTAIQDEGDASAAIPVMLRAPAELIDKAFKHFTLDRPLDEVAMKLRPELIGRIATGMDWPRELVTGISDMNHWSAWAVDESTFKGHIEPDVIVQCDELTVAYARPMLQARVDEGTASWDPALVRRVVYWYDPTELVTKPDMSGNAETAVNAGAAGRASLRKHLGLSDDDRPDQLDEVLYALPHLRGVDPHIALPILAKVAPDISWPDPATIGTTDAVTISAPDKADPPADEITPGAPPEPQSNPAADVAPDPPAQAASLIAAATGTPTGAMIAIYPTVEQAQTLAMDGGETPESIHVTLAYLGTAADLTPEQTAALTQIVTSMCAQWAPLDGEFGGIGRFTAGNSPDGDPIIATVDVPGLGSLRDQLCQHLTAAGVPLPSEHGFTPHATLAYVEADAEMPAHRLDPVPATFTAISVCLAGERTDYDLTGTGEPLVAAATPVSSQRLLDIDRQLRAKLLTACDAAVRRVLDRAGARLRSKTAKDPALRARVAAVPNPLLAAALGADGVTDLGLSADDLTAEDWVDLHRQWETWVRRAQEQARKHAARMADVAPGDPSIGTVEDAHAAGLDAGWQVLATGLSRLVTARLFNPHPDAPPAGEFDPDLTVPPGLVRQAMATAGGGAEITIDGASLPAGAWGVGQGSAVQRFLADNGMSKRNYVWTHGDTDRPLPAHEDLDGFEFTSWDDPGLANQDSFPEVDVLAPGDHDGCSCDAWINWEASAADMPVAAAAGTV